LADAIETGLSAAIVGTGDREIVLAGDNRASALIADDLVDVGDSLAVHAIGDVISKGRSNHATTTALSIGVDVNAVVTLATVGNTTHGLASIASPIIAFPAGEALRTTSAWVVPTHPVALAVGRLAGTLGRVVTGRRSIPFLARKVAGRLDVAHGDPVGRVVTVPLTLLVFDELGEVVAGVIPTNFVDDLLRHWVAVKEARKDRYTETDVDVSRKKVLAAKANIDIYIQSGANIDEVPFHMGLPRLENVPTRRSIGHGAREEQREQSCQRGEFHDGERSRGKDSGG